MAGHVLYTVRTADGIEHKSAKDAAEYLGVPRGTIYFHLHKHGHLKNVRNKRSTRSAHLVEKRAKKVKLFNQEFKSMAECSRWLGKGDSYVRILLRDNPGKLGEDKLKELVFKRLMELDSNKTT